MRKFSCFQLTRDFLKEQNEDEANNGQTSEMIVAEILLHKKDYFVEETAT